MRERNKKQENSVVGLTSIGLVSLWAARIVGFITASSKQTSRYQTEDNSSDDYDGGSSSNDGGNSDGSGGGSGGGGFSVHPGMLWY
ncbi:hypothetical protein M0802_009384 [Mischocyttarus mexicanus]|nr:hypothetical protein M0802_009384 [Mischocyttarus mexicanus]